MRGSVLGLVALALVGGACGGDDESTGTTLTTTDTPITSGTRPVPVDDVAVVPNEITVDYLQLVLDEMYRIEGEVVQSLVADGVDAEQVKRIDDLYSGELGATFANDAIQLAADPSGLNDPPGQVGVEVTELLSTDAGCAFAAVDLDFSGRAPGGQVVESFIGIGVAEPPTNPTAWVMVVNGFNADGTAPEDPCAA